MVSSSLSLAGPHLIYANVYKLKNIASEGSRKLPEAVFCDLYKVFIDYIVPIYNDLYSWW